MTIELNNLTLLYIFAAIILLSFALFFHATYRKDSSSNKRK